MSSGWSPTFLHALATELERVDRALDRLDARIERAATKRTKNRLAGQRAAWAAYEQRIRRVLAAGSSPPPRVQSEQPTKEDPRGS